MRRIFGISHCNKKRDFAKVGLYLSADQPTNGHQYFQSCSGKLNNPLQSVLLLASSLPAGHTTPRDHGCYLDENQVAQICGIYFWCQYLFNFGSCSRILQIVQVYAFFLNQRQTSCCRKMPIILKKQGECCPSRLKLSSLGKKLWF